MAAREAHNLDTTGIVTRLCNQLLNPRRASGHLKFVHQVDYPNRL